MVTFQGETSSSIKSLGAQVNRLTKAMGRLEERDRTKERIQPEGRIVLSGAAPRPAATTAVRHTSPELRVPDESKALALRSGTKLKEVEPG